MAESANKKTFRGYILFWSGQLTSILGSSVVFFVLIWWMVDTTESAVILSIGSLSYFIPFVLISPIAGVVSDRYDRKKVIFVVDSLQAFSTFIMVILFSFNIMEFWMLYFIFAFRSVCQAFHMPTQSAIIPTMVPEENLSRINGIDFLLNGIINVIGPTVGATLLVFLTVQQALWIDIITFLIALIPLLLVKIPSVHEKKEKHKRDTFWKDFKVGFKFLVSVPGLLALITSAMICNFFVQPIGSLFPYYIRVIHNGTVVDFAWISSSFNVGMFIGGAVTSVKKTWNNKVLVITSAIILHGIAYISFVFVPIGFFLLIMILSLIRGATMPFINALYYTILQTSVPKKLLGKIVSIDNSLSFVTIPVGTALSGILAEIYGIRPLYFVSALCYIFTGISIYFFTNIRQLESKDDYASHDEEPSK